MYSKDIARKPFFVRTGRTYVRTYGRTDKGDAISPPPIINGGGIKTCVLRAQRNTIRVSNALDSDQGQYSVGPDLGPKCL